MLGKKKGAVQQEQISSLNRSNQLDKYRMVKTAWLRVQEPHVFYKKKPTIEKLLCKVQISLILIFKTSYKLPSSCSLSLPLNVLFVTINVIAKEN